MQGLEITNNAEEKRSVVVETILKPLLSKQNSVSSRDDDAFGDFSLSTNLEGINRKKMLDFRDKKLPPSLIMFAQVSQSLLLCHTSLNIVHTVTVAFTS